MPYRELIPVGPLGGRLRKAFVAGALLAATSTASHLLRNPAWDGWWDAFNWPQLFLFAPVLFFFGVALCQSVCFVAEYSYQRRKDTEGHLTAGPSLEGQRTLRFWLRDSLRICLLYITACVIGDIPMVLNYFAMVRGWHFHWWWSSAVWACLFVMVVAWWTLDRIYVCRSSLVV